MTEDDDQPGLDVVKRGAVDARTLTDRVIDADPAPRKKKKGPKPRPIPPELSNVTHGDEFDDAPNDNDDEDEEQQHETDTECGLPVQLEKDKKALVAYVNMHGVDAAKRDKIEYTPTERKLYETYTRGNTHGRAPLDFFVAALRLWKHDFPMQKTDTLNLNKMRID